MNSSIIVAIICALIGAVVAYLNYAISKFVLTKHPDKFLFVTVLRQAIQVMYLVIVYFVGKETAYDIIYVLIGAVLGMTVPMFLFTKKLLNINEAFNKKDGEGGK